MKLNKNGWGLVEMLILTGIIVFFFLVAIFLIYRLYSNMDKIVVNKDYVDTTAFKNTEISLEDAANRYLNNKYENLENTNTIVLTKNKLENMGYIVGAIHADCDGYVLSSIINGKNNSDAYITCSDYETTGFESWRLNE